jgi:hypothetical protein
VVKAQQLAWNCTRQRFVVVQPSRRNADNLTNEVKIYKNDTLVPTVTLSAANQAFFFKRERSQSA